MLLENPRNPILLGEAPKSPNGYAFDWEAWTTKRLAEAIGFRACNIHKYFRPKNLLQQIQPTGPDKFDDFDHDQAKQNVGNILRSGDCVICVGSRVTQAVADFFNMTDEDVWRCIPWCQLGPEIDGLRFSRIPHPANHIGRWCYKNGMIAQPEVSVEFLISLIRERYPDAFSHRI